MLVLSSYIENSQLICKANHLTGFYGRATLAFNGLTIFSVHFSESISQSDIFNILFDNYLSETLYCVEMKREISQNYRSDVSTRVVKISIQYFKIMENIELVTSLRNVLRKTQGIIHLKRSQNIPKN